MEDQIIAFSVRIDVADTHTLLTKLQVSATIYNIGVTQEQNDMLEKLLVGELSANQVPDELIANVEEVVH